jgi:hypothetical protein
MQPTPGRNEMRFILIGLDCGKGDFAAVRIRYAALEKMPNASRS